MVVKRCSWGHCKSDSRYSYKEHMQGVTFIAFPKPKRQLERCMEWIRLCNRPHEKLNVNKIGKYHYVCSKHFLEGSDYPEPAGDAKPVRKRKAPAQRQAQNAKMSPQKRQKRSEQVAIDAPSSATDCQPVSLFQVLPCSSLSSSSLLRRVIETPLFGPSASTKLQTRVWTVTSKPPSEQSSETCSDIEIKTESTDESESICLISGSEQPTGWSPRDRTDCSSLPFSPQSPQYGSGLPVDVNQTHSQQSLQTFSNFMKTERMDENESISLVSGSEQPTGWSPSDRTDSSSWSVNPQSPTYISRLPLDINPTHSQQSSQTFSNFIKTESMDESESLPLVFQTPEPESESSIHTNPTHSQQPSQIFCSISKTAHTNQSASTCSTAESEQPAGPIPGYRISTFPLQLKFVSSQPTDGLSINITPTHSTLSSSLPHFTHLLSSPANSSPGKEKINCNSLASSHSTIVTQLQSLNSSSSSPLSLSKLPCSTTEKIINPEFSEDSPQLSALASPEKATAQMLAQPSSNPGTVQSPANSCLPDLKSLLAYSKNYVQKKQPHRAQCKSCHKDITLSQQETKWLKRSLFLQTILQSDKSCFFYTGIPTLKAFDQIFECLAPSFLNLLPVKGIDSRKEIDYKCEFVITLVKLRRGFPNRILCDLFAASQSSISTICSRWVQFLSDCFTPFIRWPSKEICKKNLPQAFQDFPNTRAVIDCAEYTFDRPPIPISPKNAFKTVSKRRNNLKQLIAIMPTGAIIFVSDVYDGSISEKSIVEKSGFLNLVEEGDEIMADRNFNIRHMLLQRKATLNIPSFTRGKRLSLSAFKRSRKVASVRVSVERAIRRMKTFRILSGLITLRLRRSLSQITRIIAFLCNLQRPLFK
ncbi:hypothetical protein PoB_000127700 [Plakobranchus ocellatus]|uniref:THAP-type domain-containing protein n=1 Tax=Plakobranchus ocellatus TaxID=259542 RepID=A0AAV3XXA0_9GAST|nr:hypothetical protein PoB_000127700 [Plakobranchus ocellatus]